MALQSRQIRALAPHWCERALTAVALLLSNQALLVVRFSAEPEEGFEAAWHIPEWADGSGADMDAFDACLTRAYDAACLACGGPKDHWLPNCDGSRRNVEARDFFAFRYQAGDAIFAEFMDDFELSENVRIFGMAAGNM